MSVKLLIIVIIDVKCHPSTYCLCKVDVSFVATLKFEHFNSKLESQPLKSYMINILLYLKIDKTPVHIL